MHSASQKLKIVMAENVAIIVTEHKIKTNNLLLFYCILRRLPMYQLENYLRINLVYVREIDKVFHSVC
jgi:hypothetical protein